MPHPTCRSTASRSPVLTCGDICVPPTVIYLPYRVSGSTLTAVGRSQLLARRPGTHSRILSGIQRAAQTVLGVYSKRTCSRETSASSELGVLNDNALYDTIRDAILTCNQKPTRNRRLKSGKTEKLKSKKRVYSEGVPVNSPGNPWSQSRRRKGRLRREGFPEKERFKPEMKELYLSTHARTHSLTHSLRFYCYADI